MYDMKDCGIVGGLKMDLPFVFIIGFNKAGTRSLDYFFENNGFPSVHWDNGNLALTMISNCLMNKKIFSGYDEKYRVFSDMMFMNRNIDIQANKFFKVMDRDYPDSYFIYNYRNTDNWVKSRLNHLAGMDISFISRSLSVHNTKDVTEIMNIWKLEKERFEFDVRHYFMGRKNFLEIDIEKDDVCKAISSLLGRTMDSAYWKITGESYEISNADGSKICLS